MNNSNIEDLSPEAIEREERGEAKGTLRYSHISYGVLTGNVDSKSSKVRVRS